MAVDVEKLAVGMDFRRMSAGNDSGHLEKCEERSLNQRGARDRNIGGVKAQLPQRLNRSGRQFATPKASRRSVLSCGRQPPLCAVRQDKEKKLC